MKLKAVGLAECGTDCGRSTSMALLNLYFPNTNTDRFPWLREGFSPCALEQCASCFRPQLIAHTHLCCLSPLISPRGFTIITPRDIILLDFMPLVFPFLVRCADCSLNGAEVRTYRTWPRCVCLFLAAALRENTLAWLPLKPTWTQRERAQEV